jgi:predicted nuclease of predicted toxin-antitoxin system
MKLLVDAHIGRLIIGFLEREGHDVLSVNSFPPRTPDVEILRVAIEQKRIVMTADMGFGELVFRLGMRALGVVLLRIHVRTERERCAVVQRFWPEIQAAAPRHFVVVTNRSVRRTPLSSDSQTGP